MSAFPIWLLIAFTLSLIITGFMVKAGLGDVPNERSSHKSTTPTAGGLGIIAGLAGAYFWLGLTDSAQITDGIILGLIALTGFLGWIDDSFTIPTRAKFVIFIMIASVSVWKIGPVTILPYAFSSFPLPYLIGFAGSMLWIFVVTNTVNFMDGSNGLMPFVMCVALIALALFSWSAGSQGPAILSAVLAAGLAGLLPYNFRSRAKIFSGDVGALTIGFGYAVAVLWLCSELKENNLVFIGPVLILPFLVDVLMTLAWRLIRGENLLTPHRSHFYQRMISKGVSHVMVAWFYGLTALILAFFTSWALGNQMHTFLSYLIMPTMVLYVIYIWVGWKLN